MNTVNIISMWSLGVDFCLTPHNNHKGQVSMPRRNSNPQFH